MNFEYSDKVKGLREKVIGFMIEAELGIGDSGSVALLLMTGKLASAAWVLCMEE